MKKVIYLHKNFDPDYTPKVPDEEDRFYTYGFGSNLAKNFKLYHPEYEVEVWRIDSYTKQYGEKVINGVLMRIFPAVMFGPFGEFSIRFIRELKKEVKKSNPILFVVHVHHWLLYQIAWFFKKSPIVTSHHGDWSPFYKIKKRKGLKKLKDFIDTITERLTLKNVDYFFICDYFSIPYIEKAAPGRETMIFSSGLNTEHFIPYDKLEAKKMLGWDVNKKYILYVGKLYDIKQPKELIEIWKEIKEEMPEVELILIGNREDEEFYPLAVKSGAQVLGRILNNQLSAYYSACEVYVLMALRDDYFGGTGIAPLESLACNTPVVSYSMRNYIGDNMSEIGEVPDSIEGYKQAIIKILKNPCLYKNMRESVEKFYSYRVFAGKSQKVFEKLFAKYKIE
ncbi:MAG: glycosyltransferase [Ignavibacteriae bacterium]|nr:MAG: glycosyltransferase [Ignavibacteriota bacterium]